MSIRASNWAWETGRRLRLNQGELLVLVRVADHADNDGRCWPGVQGIAEYTCMEESTVRRNLRRLEERGLIQREHRRPKEGRGRLTDAINLQMDQPGDLHGRSEPTNRAKKDARSTPTNRANGTRPTGHSDGGLYVEEPPGTVETPDQRSGVSRTKAQIPDHVSSLLPHLNRVGERKGAKPLRPEVVHRHCEKFGDRDFEVEAEKFVDYWLTGAGQNRDLNDVAGAWRNWLRTAPPATRSILARRQSALSTRAVDPADLPEDGPAVEAWERTSDALRVELGDSTFQLWIAKLAPLELKDGRLVLVAPGHAAAWLSRRYSSVIARTLVEQDSEVSGVEIIPMQGVAAA